MEKSLKLINLLKIRKKKEMIHMVCMYFVSQYLFDYFFSILIL